MMLKDFWKKTKLVYSNNMTKFLIFSLKIYNPKIVDYSMLVLGSDEFPGWWFVVRNNTLNMLRYICEYYFPQN